MGVLLAQRDKVKPLGSHTCVGHLHSLDKWKDIPFLQNNHGMLPPLMIAVGSRIRVLKSPETLGMKNHIFLDEKAREVAGLEAYGRVAMAIGELERNGSLIPITVFETQMGCSATQINLKEALYFARDDGYNNSSEIKIASDGIYVVRVGTCAGVNSFQRSEIQVQIGDLLIATDSYGSIGALIQSTLQALKYTGVDIAAKADELRKLLREYGNLRLSHDDSSLVTSASTRVVLRLQRSADALGLKNLVGPNFAKDSLYAEIGEEGFAMLRDIYGVISTEMEAPAVDVLAGEFRRAGIHAYSGLVSAAIGAIPGKSFAETTAERQLASNAETNAMNVAANALADIAVSLNKTA